MEQEYKTPLSSSNSSASLNFLSGDGQSVGNKSETSSDNETQKVLSTKPMKNSGNTISVNKTEVLKLLEEQNLQKQRLLRKAEQARLSRKRKKQRMQDLESECTTLRKEVKRLKAALDAQEMKLAQAASANSVLGNPQCDTETQGMYKSLEMLVTEGKEDGISHHISEMVETVKRRKPNVEKYLDAFASRISPSLPVRFLQWIFTKDSKFYEDKRGLWNSLFVEEAGLSIDQMEELKKVRKLSSEPPFDKDELIHQLSNHLNKQFEYQSNVIARLNGIMTPSQMAKFLLWVQKHGEVCIKIR
eukprot:CAMPEP_0167763142 /NCGR_PEP_ID=MMETSP0110_2-20121227/13183_1 /TAXON_ID=629695 /ORGANISM="Gymnochlora sp., Strain CCMP2014" /LENGTH=301 /DNA_ID=CAMNT_0007650143 /DNA_START=564 /DNA_END=1469 /DNA_ORIENTATION=+